VLRVGSNDSQGGEDLIDLDTDQQLVQDRVSHYHHHHQHHYHRGLNNKHYFYD